MPPKILHQLRRIPLSHELVAASLLVIAAAVAALSFYGYTRLTQLSQEVSRLSEQLSTTTALLQNGLSNATTSIENALQATRQNVQEQLGGVQSQVGTITGTVENLQKLSKTDPELLAKYSKVFFLSDTYAPARLRDIPQEYLYNESKTLQLVPEVVPYLINMINQAKSDGVTIYVYSAYRSFNTQEALKGQYKVTYGSGTANSFSADQGYSEHQLGTTVDLITTGLSGQLTGFDKTSAYAWLEANAYRYGFVLSYPKNNGYYIFEPWHWRFVGTDLAAYLHTNNEYFYTLDQRTIDKYLISIFD